MRTLLIALAIVGTIASHSSAYAWTAPTAAPPGDNVSSPINVGSTPQLKNGTLGVNGLGVFGNTILNGINGDNNGNGVNSYLNFGATAGQNGYGIRDNNGTLEFKNYSGSWGSLNVTLTNLYAGQRHHGQRSRADHLHQVWRRHNADHSRRRIGRRGGARIFSTSGCQSTTY